MIWRALPLLAALPLGPVACGEATGPSVARLGEPFTLGVGQVALLEPADLLVGFAGVPADSRCPADVTCVTAGDASVELWLRQPPSSRETRVLHTDLRAGESAEYEGFEIQLLSLEPAPRSDTVLEPSAYRAGLLVR
jgi:hypothetical protein